MTRWGWVAALAVWGAAPVLAAGTLPADMVAQIDRVVTEEMAAKNLPGVALAVHVPGRGDYVAAWGEADLASGLARSVDDHFRIGSVTKTAIGTLVLGLVADGKLALDDPIARWFPDFPNADSITVEDLLRMRSGIKDSWDEAMLARYYADPMMPVSADDMIAMAAANGAGFVAPDTVTVYTNGNFLLLEKIAEAAGGAASPELLEQRVFAPLGLQETLMPTGPELPGPLRGYGWDAAAGRFDDRTELNPAPVGGAGAMISTLADMSVWVRALCRGALLTPAAQAERLRTTPLEGAPASVGYGEAVAMLGPFCGHNGTIMGSSTDAWYLPAEDASVVVNVNRLDADDRSFSTDIFLKVAKIVFPDRVDW